MNIHSPEDLYRSLVVTPILTSPSRRSPDRMKEKRRFYKPTNGVNMEELNKKLREKILENFDHIQHTFESFDVNNDGYIDISDLQRVLTNFCLPISKELFLAWMERLGFKETDKIQYKQFLRNFESTRDPSYALPYKKSHVYNPVRGDEERLDPESIFLLMKKLVSEHHGSLKFSFLKLDDNKDGSLNWKEFRKVLSNFPTTITDAQFIELMKIIDPKKKKTISYHEFLNMFEERETEEGHPWLRGSHVPKHSLPPPALNQTTVEKLIRDKIQDNWATFTKAYTTIDLDQDGFISKKELAVLLNKYTLPISKEHFERMWEKCDENHDGKIQFSEFMNKLGVNIYANDLDGFSKRIHDESDMKIKSSLKYQEERSRQETLNQQRFSSSITVQKVFEHIKNYVLQRSSSFRKTFLKFDEDLDGKISKKEFRRLLTHLELYLDEENFKSLLSRFNFVKGKLSYTDFLSVFQEPELCNRQLIKKSNHRYNEPIEATQSKTAEEALALLRKKMEEESATLRQAFKRADFNNDFRITRSEFRRLLEEFMMPLNREQFGLLMDVLGVKEGDKINYNTFLEKFERQEDLKVGHPWLFTNHRFNDSRAPENISADKAFRLLAEKATDQWKDLATAYRTFDRDQNTYINKKELKKILRTFNIPVDDTEFTKLWKRFDTDKNNRIDHTEFLHKLGSELAPGDGEGFSSKIVDDNILQNKMQEERQKSMNNAALKNQVQISKFMDAIEVENRLRDKFRDGYENLRKAFRDCDANNDGFLSKAEFQKVLQHCHYYMENNELKKLLRRIGLAYNDKISYRAFLRAFECSTTSYLSKSGRDLSNPSVVINAVGMDMADVIRTLRKRIINNISAIYKAMKSFDKFDDGIIQITQLHTVINTFCLKTTKEQFQEFLVVCNIPNEEYLSYKEFLASVQQPSVGPKEGRCSILKKSNTRINSPCQLIIVDTPQHDIQMNVEFDFSKEETNGRTYSPLSILEEQITSQRQILSKLLKYADKMNQYTVTIDVLQSLLEKCDVHVSMNQLYSLLWKFNIKITSNRISYVEFLQKITGVFCLPSPTPDLPKNVSPTQKFSKTSSSSDESTSPQNLRMESKNFTGNSQLDAVLIKIQAKISKNLKPMQREFRAMDKIGSGSCSLFTFRNVLQKYKITLSSEDIYQLFSYFDKTLSGNIPYMSFLSYFA